ncbi:hypothetical protein KY290_027831 [Solanum tuberosum]|uniref:Uncharacterized protein n=1 Tax=Solanum tuberosum TaxID=4113 RepID=A0ABQ7UHW2_SOLTU|nr:hypothetical protein KY290_027831 [Solanum tuberosum]
MPLVRVWKPFVELQHFVLEFANHSHTSKLLIEMELDVLGLVACPKEGISDSINYVSHRVLVRVLFLYERDSI